MSVDHRPIGKFSLSFTKETLISNIQYLNGIKIHIYVELVTKSKHMNC